MDTTYMQAEAQAIHLFRQAAKAVQEGHLVRAEGYAGDALQVVYEMERALKPFAPK